MKIQLCAINSKYIHTNIALRYLKNYAIVKGKTLQNGYEMTLCEYTINQLFDDILRDIYFKNADIIAFSCYLWNIELVKRLCGEIKKIMPNVKIILGGPEVSYDSKEILAKIQNADIIIKGEGEETFNSLLSCLKENSSLSKIDGITYRDNNNILENIDAMPMDMADLPFAYDDIDQLQHKILYFESSRGCPFSCSYCLSSIEKGVRFMPTDLATSYLKKFIDRKVPQVKFVDRTFNAKRQHANDIIKFIIDNDNGITNFHFEISADILHSSTIELIKTARKGLFQFEVGVQSTSEKTLQAISRSADYHLIFQKVKQMRESELCHIHMDLIAGLPFEDYNTFKNSYNTVFKEHPDMLQLGFLKVLKGSKMHKDCIKYDMKYQDYAPYEILCTPWISYGELSKLKRIDELNDSYLNSGRFIKSLFFVLEKFSTPFDFFEKLVEYFESRNLFDIKWGKYDCYTYLYDFHTKNFGESEDLKWAMRYDAFTRENAKSLPDFMNMTELINENRKKIEAFYSDNENIEKYLPNFIGMDMRKVFNSCHIEIFPYKSKGSEITAILFDYSTKDFNSNATTSQVKLN